MRHNQWHLPAFGITSVLLKIDAQSLSNLSCCVLLNIHFKTVLFLTVCNVLLPAWYAGTAVTSHRISFGSCRTHLLSSQMNFSVMTYGCQLFLLPFLIGSLLFGFTADFAFSCGPTAERRVNLLLMALSLSPDTFSITLRQ